MQKLSSFERKHKESMMNEFLTQTGIQDGFAAIDYGLPHFCSTIMLVSYANVIEY